MAATLNRIVLDRQGNPQMIVVPDSDAELDDPAFSPPNTYKLDVLKSDYTATRTPRDLLAVIQPKLVAEHPLLASIVQARMDLADAVDQAQADIKAWNELVDRWPAPTQPQQTLMTIAAVKMANSVQAAQTKRDALAALIAQLP